MSRPHTRACLKQLALVVDLGGSSTKASTCEYNIRGDIQEFQRVTKWPGRTEDIPYAPTIVAQSSKAYSGETERSWGWEAVNDLTDHGSAYTRFAQLKSHMMEQKKTPEKDEMDSICLFYVRSLLDHLIAGRRSESLLIEVAVPMLVDMTFHERLKMTNSYKEIFRLAWPKGCLYHILTEERMQYTRRWLLRQSCSLTAACTNDSQERILVARRLPRPRHSRRGCSLSRFCLTCIYLKHGLGTSLTAVSLPDVRVFFGARTGDKVTCTVR